MKSGLNLFLASGVLSLMIAGPAWADPLSAADIRKLAPATYRVSVADSVKATVILKSGGGISVATNKGERDTGRWSVAGDKICVQFRHLLDHKPHCSYLRTENGVVHGDGFSARRN